MRGTERVLQKFPLNMQLLLIVTRMGRDYRPVRAADRAGCPKGSLIDVLFEECRLCAPPRSYGLCRRLPKSGHRSG